MSVRKSTDSQTVFVVDDDAGIRESLTALLTAEGYDVAAFASGNSFLESVPADAVGCLLLDLRMPGRDGHEVHALLKERNYRLPVVFLSGHGDIRQAVAAMRAGAVDFLEKPVDPEILVETVERAMGAGEKARERGQRISEAKALIERLSDREREVFDLLVEGFRNKEVARVLEISPRTVEIHRARVFEKTGSRTLSRLVRIALEARVS